jgi:hypothetical protein
VVLAFLLATPAFADPISRGPASAGWPSSAAFEPPAGDGSSPESDGPLVRWPTVLAGACVLSAVGVLLWSFERSARRYLRQDRVMRDARIKAQKMLYTDLSLDEAQRIIWAFEEMTEKERSELPLERRVEIRQISSDLEAHKRRWNLG